VQRLLAAQELSLPVPGVDWGSRGWFSSACRQVDRKAGLQPRVGGCLGDFREREPIAHRREEMLAQRICGLTPGSEERKYPDPQQRDRLPGVLAGKGDLAQDRSAGKSS